MATVTISLDTKDIDQLNDLTRSTGFSRSSLCRLALKELIRKPEYFLRLALNDNVHNDDNQKAAEVTP